MINHMRHLTSSLVIVVSLLFVAALLAQQPPGGGGGKKGMPAPKNLQVLKVPPTNLLAAMNSYRVALGVQCTFCHAMGDFASDDNPHKVTARMMITMVQDINAKFPDGQEHVTCYTCHRGANMPLTEPPPAPPAAQ
jgi:hypothetical protein